MYKKLKLVESASDRYQVREFDGPGAKFGVYDTKTKKFVQKGSKKVMTAACEDLNKKNKKLKEGSMKEYRYITTHGIGPGTVPKGTFIRSEDLDNYKTAIYLNRPLTSEELKKYDIKPEWIQESAKLTEADDDLDDLKDKAEEDLENKEELEDTVDSEEDQEENPVEEESELDKQLNELRDILIDLDLNLYQITDKEDLNNSIYVIGKVADESNDILMLVDTQPEEVNSEEIPEEEPIIDNIDIDNADIDTDEDKLDEAEDNSSNLEKAKKIIENCGFTIQDENQTDWEIQQYTPEGEDWFVDIIVNNDVNKLIEEISSYAENFDIDEEVEPYIEMRGQRGVPSSISDLIEDAKWKKDQLANLANELQKLKSDNINEEYIPNHNSLKCPKCGSNKYIEVDDGEYEDGTQEYHYECSDCGYKSNTDEININETAELVKVLRNPENSEERVEIKKLPNGKYQTLYYSDEKSFSGAQSQFDDLDSAISQAQKLRPTYKLDEADERTYKDEDEAAYYRNKELYANSNLAKHREAMEKAAKACKEKGIKLEEDTMHNQRFRQQREDRKQVIKYIINDLSEISDNEFHKKFNTLKDLINYIYNKYMEVSGDNASESTIVKDIKNVLDYEGFDHNTFNIDINENLKESEEIEVSEEPEEDEHKTELEQRFDFVKLPNTFEEVNKLNPRYGEELTPDHEAIVEYLMNCLIEMNPEAAEELQKEDNEETPIEPEEDIDLDIDIDGEEDLEDEDQY